ncbi:MAG: class I SAM-dependent methyltransferase [Pseudorhodoplanes sp.]
MSGFSAQWLTLRERYDNAARNPAVLDAVAAAFASRSAISVTDLACGTGSTRRAIASRLPARQHWRMVDNDLSLLARARPAEMRQGTTITTVPVDLARDLEMALDGAVELVTASALLDLVSEEWLERFVTEIAARRLPVYAALNYDGRTTCGPVDAFDAAIAVAVNRHQLTDKGFGPALGPAAAMLATTKFQELGYAVTKGASDWLFAVSDREIQFEMVSGWARAARELDEYPLEDIVGWLTRRRDHIAAGRSTIVIGHIDFFARPGAR